MIDKEADEKVCFSPQTTAVTATASVHFREPARIAMGSIYSTLFSGLWSRLFGMSEEFKICIIGLDNAGKTTVLYKLHLDEVVSTNPTIGANVEEVVHKNVRF